MAKKIRFPLVMTDDTKVTKLEELREHFELETVVEYYKNGKLLTWLQDRYFEDEAEAVAALDDTAPDFQAKLCEIFGVAYSGQVVDLEEVARRQERLARLRAYTDESEYLGHIDQVAFDQEDLADLLDDEKKMIYLCGDKFMIPVSQKGISYIGINAPSAHLSGKLPKTLSELDIQFTDVSVDNLPGNIQTATNEKSGIAVYDDKNQKSLSQISDEAFYACFDKLGLHTFVETENYIMYIDRELGWECQNIKKHLYDKRTKQDTVTLLKTMPEIKDEPLDYEFYFGRSNAPATLDERKSKITEGEDSLLYFFANAVVAAVYKDTVYYAVKNLKPSYYGSEDAKKVFIYSYDLFTDERKELLNFIPFNDCNDPFNSTHFLLVANDNYLIYDDDAKRLCSFDLATQERRQILINGEPTRFADRQNFTNTLGRCMTKGDILLCKQGEELFGSGVLYYYNLKTKNICEASTEDFLAAGHLCGNSLFFLTWPNNEFLIAKSNDAPKKLFDVNGLYGSHIRGYSDGVVISVVQGNGSLYYIDPIGNTVELATECGCGYRITIFVHANPFIRIGRTVYFKVGDDNYRKVSIDHAHEVEQIPSKDDSGRVLSGKVLSGRYSDDILYYY